MTLRLHPHEDDSNLPGTGKVLATLVAESGSITMNTTTGKLTVHPTPDASSTAREQLRLLQDELDRIRCVSGSEHHTYLSIAGGKPVRITAAISDPTPEGAQQRETLALFVGNAIRGARVSFCDTKHARSLISLIQGYFDRIRIRLHDPS